MNALKDLTLSLSAEAVTNPTHLSFSNRSPLTFAGGPTLILTSDTYASSTDVNLNLKVISEVSPGTYSYAVSQVLLTEDDGSIKRTQLMNPTSRPGEYALNVQLISDGHIALIAYPTKRPLSRLTFTRGQYLNLPVVSNPVCIVATRSRSTERQDLESVTDRHASNLSQSLLAPMTGASGSSNDYYRMHGMSPSNTRFPSAEQQTARQTIQGGLEELSSRLAGFSEFLHSSHMIGEVPSLTATRPLELAEPYKRYQDALTSGSSLITSVLEGQRYNPATGNTVSQNLGNQHLVSSQYRLESTSALDLRSPLLVNSAQVQLVDVRDYHQRAYVSQSSNTHRWQRVEETDTQIADTSMEFVTAKAYRYSAERQDITGKHHLYADNLTVQVGLSPPVTLLLDAVDKLDDPLAITNPASLVEGLLANEVAPPEPRNAQLLVENNLVTQTTLGDISVAAARDLVQYANASVFIRSNAFLSIDSSLVFINCRAIRPPLPPTPPQKHIPMVPVAPLPKASIPPEGAPYDLTSETRLPTTIATS